MERRDRRENTLLEARWGTALNAHWPSDRSVRNRTLRHTATPFRTRVEQDADLLRTIVLLDSLDLLLEWLP